MNIRNLHHTLKPLTMALLGCQLVALAGCEKKLERFDLSGSVEYSGKPVAAGYMVFTPDKSAGNSGPGSSADIRDGRFATLEGAGTIGGPHIVQISGFDGRPYTQDGIPVPLGKPVFRTTVTVDLPKQNGTYDFSPAMAKR